MDYDLPSEFDLIVIGTGFVESVVSAAASRIGKRVLHVDSVNYYGGIWASFNLESINALLNESNEKLSATKSPSVKLDETEKLILLGNDLFGLKDAKLEFHVPEKATIKELTKSADKHECTESGDPGVEESGTEEHKTATVNDLESANVTENVEIIEPDDVWSRESLLKESKKFNIDLAPKLHFARGDFVELLISSNISRYSEFCSVSRVLTWLNGQLEIVPCSRSDVFSNSKVTVIEKRMLMKLLTTCLDGDEKEFSGYENKTFLAFLKSRKLTPNLIHYVLYTISMSNDDTPFSQGIQNTRRFLNSLGRYGKTPFLFSLYGSGDITQAFCRLSAVFGGTYALNQSLNGIVLDHKHNFKALIIDRQRISAENVVIGVDKAPKEFVASLGCKKFISRGIFITDRSILESEREHLTLLVMPPENAKNACIVLEAGYLTRTCPKGLFIVYMYSEQKVNAQDDLQHCVEKLFDVDLEDGVNEGVAISKPKVLWSLYFSVPDISDVDLRKGVPKNVFVCSGPDADLDYDCSIKKAKTIFSEMYPDLEFLPRAPDPEEIIIGDEGEDTDDDVQQKVENDEEESKEDTVEKKDASNDAISEASNIEIVNTQINK